ncbi:MAG: PilZ domain-containing protein [Desulfomicrobium sp.]|nr:PilZ domain-containing protein [Desulfomicrobium sp.]
MQERRKRSRVKLALPLTIFFNGKQIRGMINDLSLKGLSCKTETMLLPGKECDITLELDSGIRIHIHGRIIRSGQDGAVDFLSMDTESFAHLRNLVRLYAEDADSVDAELSNPAFTAIDYAL